MFMRPVIIPHQVQLQFFRKLVVPSAQKLQECLVAMPGKALTNHFSFQNFQGREQGCCSVTDIADKPEYAELRPWAILAIRKINGAGPEWWSR